MYNGTLCNSIVLCAHMETPFSMLVICTRVLGKIFLLHFFTDRAPRFLEKLNLALDLMTVLEGLH